MAFPLFIKFLSELLNEPEVRTIFLLITSDDLSKIFNDLSKIKIIRKFTYDIIIKVNIFTKEGLKLWNFRKYIIENNCLEGILSSIKSNYFTSSFDDIYEIFRELNNLLILCAAFYETQKDFKNEIFNFLYKIFEDLLLTSVNEETVNDEIFYFLIKRFISEIFYLAYIDKDDLKPKLNENTLYNLDSNKSLVNHTNNFKDFEVIEFLLTLFSNISEVNNFYLNSQGLFNHANLTNFNSNEKLNSNPNYNSNYSRKSNSNIKKIQNNENVNPANEKINNHDDDAGNILFEKTEFVRKIILTHLLDNDISLNKYKNIINNTNYCKIILENLHTYSEELISYPFNSILLIISEMGIPGTPNDSHGQLPYIPEKEIKSILKNLYFFEDEIKINIIIKHFKLFFDFYQNNFQKLFINCGYLNILKDILDQTIHISKINTDGGLLFSNNIYSNNTINLNNYNSGENSSVNNRLSNFSAPNNININDFSNLNIPGINNGSKFNMNQKDMRQPASLSLLIKLIEFLEIILQNNHENIQKYKSLFFLDNYFEILTQFSEYKSIGYKIWNLTISFEQEETEIIKYTKFLSKRYHILKETILIVNTENQIQIKFILEEIYTINEIIYMCFKIDNYYKILSNIKLIMNYLKKIFLDFFDLIVILNSKFLMKNDLIYPLNNDNNNFIINKFPDDQNKNNLINVNYRNKTLISNFEDFNINSNLFSSNNPKNNENNFLTNKNISSNNTYLNNNDNQNELNLMNINKTEFFDIDIHNLIKNYLKLYLGMIFKFNQTIFAIEFKSQKNSIVEGINTRKFENFITKKNCKENIKKILLFYNSLSNKKYLPDIVYFLAETSLRINILEKKNEFIQDKRNSNLSDKPFKKTSTIYDQNKIIFDYFGEKLCENLSFTFKEKYKLEEHELNNVYVNVSNYSNFILQSPFIIKMILNIIVKDLNNVKFLYDFIEFIYLLCQVNETNIKLLLKCRIIKILLVIIEDDYFNNIISNKFLNINKPIFAENPAQENNDKRRNDDYINSTIYKDNNQVKLLDNIFIEDGNYYTKKEKLEILEKIQNIPNLHLDLIKTTIVSKIMEIIELCTKFCDKKDIELFLEHLYLSFSRKKQNYNHLERLINILKKNLKASRKINRGIILSPLVTKQPSFYNMLYTSNIKLNQDRGSKEANKNKSNIISILISITFHRNFENNSIFTIFRLEREIKDKDICVMEAIIENGILKIKENDRIIPCEDLNSKNIFVELEKAYNIAFIISKEKNLLEVFINEKQRAVIPFEYKFLELTQSYNLINGYSCSTTREAMFDNFNYIPHISFSYFMIYNDKLEQENLIFLKISEILSGKNGSAAGHQIKRKHFKKKILKIFALNYQHQKEKLKYIRIGIDPKKLIFEIVPDKFNFYTNNQIMKLKSETNFCNNFIYKIQRKYFLDVTEKDFLVYIPNTNISNEDKAVFNNTFLLSKLNESEIISQIHIFEITNLKVKIKEKVFNLNTSLDLEISSARFLDNFFSVLFECKENLCFNSLLNLMNVYMLSNIGEMVEFCDNHYLAILSAILYKKNSEYKNLLENDLEGNDDDIEEVDEEINKILGNENNSSEGDGINTNDLGQNNLNNPSNNLSENSIEKYISKFVKQHSEENLNQKENIYQTGNLENDTDQKLENFDNNKENDFNRKSMKKSISLKPTKKSIMRDLLNQDVNSNYSNLNRNSLIKLNLNMNLDCLENEKTELIEKIKIQYKINNTNIDNFQEMIKEVSEKVGLTPDLIRYIEISNIIEKEYGYDYNQNNINKEKDVKKDFVSNNYNEIPCDKNNNNLDINSAQINSIEKITKNKNLRINLKNPTNIINKNDELNTNNNNTLNNNSNFISGENVNSIATSVRVKKIIDTKTLEILFNLAFGIENYEDFKLNFFNPLFPKIITEVIFDLNFFRKLDDKVKVFLIEKMLSFFNQSDYIFINSEVNYEIKVNILSKMFKILMLIPYQEEVDQFAISLIINLLEQILKFKKREFEPTEYQLKKVINCTQEFILVAGYFNDLITSHFKTRDFDQEELDNTNAVIRILFKKLFEEKTKIAREMILATFTKIWEDLSISQTIGDSTNQQQELRKSMTHASINKLDNLLNPSFFLKLYNKEINNKNLNYQKTTSSVSKVMKPGKIVDEMNKRNIGTAKKKENVNDFSFISKKKISKEKENKGNSKNKIINSTSTNITNSKNSKSNSLDEKDKPGEKSKESVSKTNNIIGKNLRNSKLFEKTDSLQLQMQYQYTPKINNLQTSKIDKNDQNLLNFDLSTKDLIKDKNRQSVIRSEIIAPNTFTGVLHTNSKTNNNSIFIYDSNNTNNNNNENNNKNFDDISNIQGDNSVNFNVDYFIKKNSLNKNYKENVNFETQQFNNIINNSSVISQNLNVEFDDSIDYTEFNNSNNNNKIISADYENEAENNLDLEGECKGEECRLCNLIANLQQSYFNLILKIQESKKILKKFFYYQNLKYYNKPAKILKEKEIDFSWYIFNHEGAARIKNKLITKMNAIKNEELNKKYYGNGNCNTETVQKKFSKSDYNTDKKSNFEKIFDSYKIKKFVSLICNLDQIFRLNFIKNLINPNDEFISAYNCLIVKECHHTDAVLIIGKNQFYILTNLHIDREGNLTYSKHKFRKSFWVLNDYNEDWDQTCPYLSNSGYKSAAKLNKLNNLNYNTYNNYSQNINNNDYKFINKDLKRINKNTQKKFKSNKRKFTIEENRMLKFCKMRKGFKFYSFSYDRINEIFKRRFLMKNNSLEIFLRNGRDFYLCFNTDKRDAIFLHFLNGISQYEKRGNSGNTTSSNKAQINNISSNQMNSPNCYFSRNGKIVLKKTKGKLQKNHKQIVDYKQIIEDIQDYWEKGVISNFNYLMILNTLAGRSYNDISQYLVMPWIIKDYSSEGLNLNNYETYRDLTRPIHAIDDNTYKNLSIKYNEADDYDKFHSGSHYSSPGFVCYFMIRLKPFSYISSEIQGGYFDIADRLFNNIKNLWEVNDKYQELIPEMFYFPELFINFNEFDFGTNQNYSDVNDVILPSWARNDPRLFAKMNKKALESSKISEKLSEWIDLIFGIKQQGKEAVKALNVFRPLCYEGKIDICKLEKRDQDDKMVEIHDFGQVPIQLFNKHHNKKEKHLNSAAFFSKLHYLIHFKEKEKSVNLNLENFPENLKFYSECENYLSYGEGGMTSFLTCYDNEEKTAKFNNASNTLILVGHRKFLIGPKYISYVDYSFNKFAFAIVYPLYKISFIFNTFSSSGISNIRPTSDGKRLIIAFDNGILKVYRIFSDKKDRVFHPDYEKKKDKGFFGLFTTRKESNSSNANVFNTNVNTNIGNNTNNQINFDKNNYNYNYNYTANTNNYNNINQNIIGGLSAHNLYSPNFNYNTNASIINNFSSINNSSIGAGNLMMNNNDLINQNTISGLNCSFVEINNFITEIDLRDILKYENFNNNHNFSEKILYPLYKFNSNVSDYKDFQIYYNNCNHELTKSSSKGAKNVTLKLIKENKFFYNEIKIMEICECYSLLVGIDIMNTLYICELNKFEVLKTFNLNKVLPKIDEIIHISIDSSSGDFIVVSSLYVVLFNLNGVILAVLDLREYPKFSKITTALIKSVKFYC